MQQFQFVVDESGLLAEAAAIEQANWYASKHPDLEPLDFQAHIMLIRAAGTLDTEAPFDRKGGVSKARYNVLRMIHGVEDHRVLMTDIVQTMNVSPTNITKLVDGLEGDGYVRRVNNVNDKRKVWVELLPSGAAVVEEALPEVVRHVSGLWEGVTREEKRLLVHLLSRVRFEFLTQAAAIRIETFSTNAAISPDEDEA